MSSRWLARALLQPSSSIDYQQVVLSTEHEIGLGARAAGDDAAEMTDYMTLGYAVALGEARSCLTALADTATDVGESTHYDRLLLRLDLMHEDYPGCRPLTGSRQELLNRFEAAVDALVEMGADGLSMELLLDSALDPAQWHGHARR